LARPAGAVLFGHFGDRVGRRATLVATLLITGAATFGIGLVPTYAQIGVWAPVLLMSLRIVQGLALGGEWTGSVLLSIEWQHFYRWRGFFASFPQLGTAGGMLIGVLVLTACNEVLTPAQFAAWGWRIPFWLGGLMMLI